MQSFDNLMDEFKEKAKGADKIKMCMLAIEYGKIIEKNFTPEEKNKFMQYLTKDMSNDDLEKAKSMANLLKK